MAETSEAKVELNLFGHLLTPSFTSGLVACLLTALIVGRVLLGHIYTDTGSVADVLKTIAASNRDFIQNHQPPTSQIVANALVFVIWGVIGTMVYLLAFEMIRLIGQTNALHAQLGYVHADRQALTREFARRITIRVGAALLLFGVAALLLNKVLPYALDAAAQVVVSLTVLDLVNLVLGVLLLLVSFHAITVLLRLILLRPRLFSNEIYL